MVWYSVGQQLSCTYCQGDYLIVQHHRGHVEVKHKVLKRGKYKANCSIIKVNKTRSMKLGVHYILFYADTNSIKFPSYLLSPHCNMDSYNQVQNKLLFNHHDDHKELRFYKNAVQQQYECGITLYAYAHVTKPYIIN